MFYCKMEYGYEFLPNYQRLVITPLTERAYQSIFLAMSYQNGHAIYGPSGVGKTETISDLASKMGRNFLVYNCQKNMDMIEVTNWLAAISACGYWTCFHDFNSVDPQILTALSVILGEIQDTKKLVAS